MNAINMLEEQHREAEALFAKIEAAKGDDKRELFSTLAEKLRAHMELEEQIFYPAAYKVDAGEVNHGREEHDDAKPLISDLLELDHATEQFQALFHDLKDKIDHHVKEEERDLFPECRKTMSDSELDELGDEMQDLLNEIQHSADPTADLKKKPGDRAMQVNL